MGLANAKVLQERSRILMVCERLIWNHGLAKRAHIKANGLIMPSKSLELLIPHPEIANASINQEQRDLASNFVVQESALDIQETSC